MIRRLQGQGKHEVEMQTKVWYPEENDFNSYKQVMQEVIANFGDVI